MANMRKLIESVDKTLNEGKYGPHGRAVDAGIEKYLTQLGDEPTVEEIYAARKDLISELEDAGETGMFVNSSYISRQFIGAVAEKLELPGLFSNTGSSFVDVEKDDAGRYRSYANGSRAAAEELAQKGYLSDRAAEKLGVTNILGMEFGDANSDDANAVRNTQTMASGRRNVRREVARFMELLAKRNVVSDGIVYESALARLLTEALSDAEEAEFQELLAKVQSLDPASYDDEETKTAVQAAVDAAKNIETPAAQTTTTAAEPEAEPAATSEPASGNTDNALAKFADSGKGGLANDPDEVAAIKELQQRLTALGWELDVDGKYGPATKRAVSGFQTMMGATADGDAGPETIKAIVKAESIPGIREFYNDTNELIALIDKGALYTESANSERREDDANISYTTPYDQFSQGNTRTLQNNSIDFRSLISLVENSLLEAVSEQEQARALELYNKHKTKYVAGNTEADYMAGMPKTFQDRINKVNQWTKTDAISNAPASQDQRAAGSFTSADPVQDGEPRPTESGVQGDYAKAAWDALYDGYLDPATGNVIEGGKVPARPAAPTPQQLQGGSPDNTTIWDRRWAATHNADGTPKG